MRGCGSDWYGSGYEKFVNCGSGSIKYGEFLEKMGNC